MARKRTGVLNEAGRENSEVPVTEGLESAVLLERLEQRLMLDAAALISAVEAPADAPAEARKVSPVQEPGPAASAMALEGAGENASAPAPGLGSLAAAGAGDTAAWQDDVSGAGVDAALPDGRAGGAETAPGAEGAARLGGDGELEAAPSASHSSIPASGTT